MSTIFTTGKRGTIITLGKDSSFTGTLNDDHTTYGVPAPRPPKNKI